MPPSLAWAGWCFEYLSRYDERHPSVFVPLATGYYEQTDRLKNIHYSEANMVRTLAGTALNFAEGCLTEKEVEKSLLSGDRESVGRTLPPNGLTLEEVDYGFSLFE